MTPETVPEGGAEPVPRLGIGTIVRHVQFGTGRIVAYEPGQYVIAFRGGDTRRVAMSYDGIEVESRYVFGMDVVEELFKLSVEIAEREPDVIFVAGQVVFERETVASRLLHNEVAFALQRRLIFEGINMVVLPVRVPEEIW